MKKGISASKGYAIGKVVVKMKTEISIEKRHIDDVIQEKERFQKALELSKSQLEKIKAKAEKEVGKDKAEVFESHIMLLDDVEFAGAVTVKIVNDHVNAESALYDIVDLYMKTFQAMEDEYMRERGADIKDVGSRILANLTGNNSSIIDMENNTVVVAHDLTPSDTAQLDKSKVIAFVTDIGGRTSHSAIMARTLEIPAVVGLNDITDSVKDGDLIIVDGVEGEVIINPDKNTLNTYKIKKRKL